MQQSGEGDRAVHSFPPPASTRDTESAADIHLAGSMQTKNNKPKRGGRQGKRKPKSRKIRVYNYVHKKSGFRRPFARNRVYVDRGWVG